MESHCEEHNKHVKEFLCFNVGCFSKKLLCILCLKEKHSNCKPEYIVSLDQVRNSDSNLTKEQIGSVVSQHMSEKSTEVKEAVVTGFKGLKEKIQQELTFSSYENEDVLYLNGIKKLKENYTISFDGKGEILFNPKIKNDKVNTEVLVRTFKSKLNNLLHTFIKQVDELKIDNNYDEVFPTLLKYDKGIELKEKDGKFILTPKPNDDTKNRTVVFQKRLTNFVLRLKPFQVTDKKIDNYFKIEIGVMNGKEYNAMLDKERLTYESNSFTPYITSKAVKNLNTKFYRRKESSLYMELDNPFFFQFKNSVDFGQSVSFSDFDNYELNKVLSNKDEYYFYVRFLDDLVGIEIDQNFD